MLCSNPAVTPQRIVSLLMLTTIYFLENFDRYLLAVSPIPYIDYTSYEYSLLSGTFFALFYAVGAVVISVFGHSQEVHIQEKQRDPAGGPLSGHEERQDHHVPARHRNSAGKSTKNPLVKDHVESDSAESAAEVPFNEVDVAPTPPITATVVVGGSRRLIVSLTAATFVFSAAFACTALATSFWQQALIRMVLGVAQSVVAPYCMGIIDMLFDGKGSDSDSNSHVEVDNNRGGDAGEVERSASGAGAGAGTIDSPPPATDSSSSSGSVKAVAFGVFNMAVYVAFSLSLSAGTALYDAYGWRVGYLLFGGLGMLFAVCIPLVVVVPTQTQKQGAGVVDGSEEAVDSHGSVCSSSRNALLEPLSPPFSPARSPSPPRDQAISSSHSNSPTPASSYCTRIYCNALSAATRMVALIADVLRSCYQSNGLVLSLLVLASGLRMGAGMVWVSYTAVYYSELFVADGSSGGDGGIGDGGSDQCVYSYNASYTADSSSPAVSSYCGDASFPYCIESTCHALNPTPWHDRGLGHAVLEQFMGFVPLVGSAVGCLLGGVLSDYLQADQSKGDQKEKSPLEGEALGVDEKSEQGALQQGGVGSSDGSSSLGHTGSIFRGTSGRCLIAGCGILLALPFVYLALQTEAALDVGAGRGISNGTDDELNEAEGGGGGAIPVCFLMLIISGIFGEAYIGLSMTALVEVLADIKMVQRVDRGSEFNGRESSAGYATVPSGDAAVLAATPANSAVPLEEAAVPLVPTVALFNLFVIVIAGNTPLLIPLLMRSSMVQAATTDHVFSFYAAAEVSSTSDHSNTADMVPFEVSAAGSAPLEVAMQTVLCSLYIVSGMLFVALAFILHAHKKQPNRRIH